MKVWQVTLNVPTAAIGHIYEVHDISAESAKRAIERVQKFRKADGLGRPYVSSVKELSDPE